MSLDQYNENENTHKRIQQLEEAIEYALEKLERSSSDLIDDIRRRFRFVLGDEQEGYGQCDFCGKISDSITECVCHKKMCEDCCEEDNLVTGMCYCCLDDQCEYTDE